MARYPTLQPFLFFTLQLIGIGFQSLFAYLLQKLGITDRLWKRSKHPANLIFTVTWLWLTFPLLADESPKEGHG